jgi:hypothetical protein
MKKIYIASLLSLASTLTLAQNIGINTTGAAPDGSAMLDVVATDKGILIPRMTTAQRTAIGSPATGLMVYDLTTTSFWQFDGSVWVENTNESSDDDGIYGGDGTTPAGTDVTVTDYVNFDANTLYLDGTNNRVGIGTATTSAELDVVGVLELSNTLPTDPGSDIVRLGDGGTNLRIQTNYGYTQIGPANASWSHFTTDRARFYFNQGITVDQGLIGSYDENLSLQTSGTTRMTVLTSNGNVGIGTTTPDNALDVNGKISITQSAGDEMVIINDDIWSHGSAANLDFGTGGDYLIVASKESQFETNGFYGDGNYSVIWNPGDNNRCVRFLDEDFFGDGDTDPFDNGAEEAYIDAAGAYVQASDSTRKENIVRIDGALDAILAVNGYTYKYKQHPEEVKKGEIQLTYGGVIAQEIEQVFPYAVQTDDYGGKFVHYDGLTGLFIEAIKEQQTEIEDYKELIELLQKQQEELMEEMKQLKSELGK